MKTKIENFSKIIILLGLFLSFSFLMLQHSLSYSDPDLPWHLRIGQDIVSSHQAPTVDKYNYSLKGGTWIDHEWLFNAGLFYLYELISWPGLQIVFFFFIVLTALLAMRRNTKLLEKSSKNYFYSGVFWLMLALFIARPHLGLRAQELEFLFLAALFYSFSAFSKNRLFFYLLPLMFLLWANLHGSFILGLALLATFTAYIFLRTFFPSLFRWDFLKLDVFRRRNFFNSLIVLILSIVATFINPYGLKLYSFLASYGNTFYMSHIQEWQPQFSLPAYYPEFIYMAFALLALIAIFIFKKNKFKFSLWEYFLFALFFILAFKSKRHFPIFALVSLPFITKAFPIFSLKTKFSKFKYYPLILLASLLIIFSLYKISSLNWQRQMISGFCDVEYPCSALSYFKAHRNTGDHLFNKYAWGGYLIWSDPGNQIFIDGRMPQRSFKGHSFLEEYDSFFSKEGEQAKLLSQYKINWVLLGNHNNSIKLAPWEKFIYQVNDKDLQAKDELNSYLQSSKQWHLVFKDNISSLYYRP